MYNKILAPLDGSKLAECSLDHLKEIAGGCHAKEVDLLTVIEEAFPPHFEYSNRTQIEAAFQQSAQEQRKARETAEKYLAGVKEQLSQQGIVAHNIVVQAEESKSVAEVILNYAESNNFDLIIISTHGRSGISRWAFGSIAERVSRHSRIPVLTVTPTGCRVGL